MGHHYKVLLADNSKSFREMFSKVLVGAQLEARQFDARGVASGADALALLDMERFDLVCSAMHLHDMDGMALSRAVRARPGYATVPFVLFTSEAQQSGLIGQSLPEGITDIFHKKDFDELLNFISRYPFSQAMLTGRILYVEDDRSVREYMTRLLLAHGLTVWAFENADQAWPHFLQHDYDLVVTDVVLTGKMSGLVFANRIRRLSGNKGDTPILAITAFNDASRRAELYSTGVDDYVTKPAMEQELISRVHNLIARRRSLLEARGLRQIAEQALLARSNFLSAMSNELRTPLNTIVGFAQLLETDTRAPLSADQLESTAAISRASAHLLEMIEDIVSLSKIDAGVMETHPEQVDAVVLVRSLLSMVRDQANERGIVIENRLTAEVCWVWADLQHYKQVLINLLTNAVKYNRLGGKITLDARCTDYGTLCLSVTDTGEGISPERLSEIFDPFTQLNERRFVREAGIGLAVSQKLVNLMGGRLSVDSELGVGSIFTVELPLVDQTSCD